MKKCSKCNIIKESEEFCKDRKNKDNLKNQCRSCTKNYFSVWQQNNLEQNRQRSRTWRNNNLYKARNSYKIWKQTNPEKVKTKDRMYAKNNPGKMNAKAMKRHASKLQATPSWLTKEQLLEIELLYDLAKELQWLSEEPLEVDHIVPLRGKNVSGLHVPWNLQILPKSLNISKNNKM